MFLSIIKSVQTAGLTALLFFVLHTAAFSQAGSGAAGVETEEAVLYERLGGLAPIALVVSDFVDVFIQDPLIMSNPAVRERKTEESAPYVKYQVTTMVCQATGGPCEYSGLGMKEAHEGLNVSEEEWDRMVELFIETMDKYQVPEQEKEEVLAIMGTTKDDIVATSGR